ncbi:hypothetical protein GCM10010524_14710 [Streptomyces mexicanus]
MGSFARLLQGRHAHKLEAPRREPVLAAQLTRLVDGGSLVGAEGVAQGPAPWRPCHPSLCRPT